MRKIIITFVYTFDTQAFLSRFDDQLRALFSWCVLASDGVWLAFMLSMFHILQMSLALHLGRSDFGIGPHFSQLVSYTCIMCLILPCGS